jgi:hypothetical protein
MVEREVAKCGNCSKDFVVEAEDFSAGGRISLWLRVLTIL